MGKFSDLPAEIMLDIFTRLPAELVSDCKSVSKTWRKVLRHPSFNQMHSNLLLSNHDSTADSGKFNFILRMNDLSERYSKRLYYLEYDEEVSSHRIRKLILNPQFEIYSVIGSCNGLVCIIGLPNHYTVDESTSASYVAYICNPITRESITLPELDRDTYYHIVDFMVCGFGYVASTNEYKVVRLYTFMSFVENHEFAQIEVYTLGSGKGWRNAGRINKKLNSMSRQHAVFVDGFIYWNFRNGRIMAFDLANEVFLELDEFWNDHLWFGVMGTYFNGTLYTKDGKNPDVWLLKKNEDGSFSWSIEFSLVSNHPFIVSPTLTSSGKVLWYSDMKLHLYDPKSSSSIMLKEFGTRIYQAIPHMNSLVSLKAFGEENTRSMEPGESTMEEAKGRDWHIKQQ